MAVLFYTIGFPCAGKTTFARQMSQWLGGSHLQADRVGRALFVTPTFSPAERIAVYQHMDYQAMTELNAGRHVLYDGTLTSLEQRHRLRQLAKQCGTKAVGVWLDLPIEVAKHRAQLLSDNSASERQIQPELFDQYVHAFQVPDSAELIIHVDGQWHFSRQYHELRRKLHELQIADFRRLL